MKPIHSFLFDNLLVLAVVMLVNSCSTPGSGPTPGQQAVMASAAHRTTPDELNQQMTFMRSYQMQMQGRAVK